MAFNGFTAEFPNTPVSPVFNSYLALNLDTASTQLYWSFIAPYETNLFSTVIQVLTNTATTNAIVLPDATLTSLAQSTYIFNSSANSFEVNNYDGSLITIIDAGDVYLLTLTDNSTEAGNWIYSQCGATPGSVVPSSLIDANPNSTNPNAFMYGGLQAIYDTETSHPGLYLKTFMYTQNVNASTSGTYQQTQGDRGSLLHNTSTGTLTYNLLSTAEAENGFIFSVNAGSSQVIFIPIGTDVIDLPTNTMQPGTSASFISDGNGRWNSLGYSLNTIPTNFNNVTIELSSGSQTLPSLSFFNDSTHSLGIWYDTTDGGLGIAQAGSKIASFSSSTINFTPSVSFAINTPTLNATIGNLNFLENTTTVTANTNLIINAPNLNLNSTTVDLQSTNLTIDAPTTNLQSTTLNVNTTTLNLQTEYLNFPTNTIMTAEQEFSIMGDSSFSISGLPLSLNSNSTDQFNIGGGNTLLLSTLGTACQLLLYNTGNAILTAVETINLNSPTIEQESISIYTLMQAYS